MRLNTRQADVLETLLSHEEMGQDDPNTDRIRIKLPRRGHASTTYDAVHSLLSRMEKRGLVKRTGKTFSPVRSGMVATWTFTEDGRSASVEHEG